MTVRTIERRALLAGLATTPALLSAGPAKGEGHCDEWLNPEQVAMLQRELIERAYGRPVEQHPHSEAGLRASLGELASKEVMEEEEVGVVDCLISLLFECRNATDMVETLDGWYETGKKWLRTVGKTITTIVRETVTTVRTMYDGISGKSLGEILAKVLCGALEGAIMAVEVAELLSRPKQAIEAALGALAGAACMTVTAILEGSNEECEGQTTG